MRRKDSRISDGNGTRIRHINSPLRSVWSPLHLEGTRHNHHPHSVGNLSSRPPSVPCPSCWLMPPELCRPSCDLYPALWVYLKEWERAGAKEAIEALSTSLLGPEESKRWIREQETFRYSFVTQDSDRDKYHVTTDHGCCHGGCSTFNVYPRQATQTMHVSNDSCAMEHNEGGVLVKNKGNQRIKLILPPFV